VEDHFRSTETAVYTRRVAPGLATALSDALLTLLPLALMALLGVPHGALDGAIAWHMYPGSVRRALFFSAYAVMVALCVGLWVMSPTVALGIFLALSWIHFGRSDHDAASQLAQPVLHTLSRGGIWAVFLPLAQWSSVASVLEAMQVDSGNIQLVLIGVAPLWVVAVIGDVFWNRTNIGASRHWLTLAFILLAATLPPLWSLCLYFCAWHSRRHARQVLAKLSQQRAARQMMLLLTALSLGLAAVAFYLLQPLFESLTAAALSVFFAGLFALTVPHMVLIDYYLPRLSRLQAAQRV
jgi:beta-carotene 15,15'-dioxygenase